MTRATVVTTTTRTKTTTATTSELELRSARGAQDGFDNAGQIRRSGRDGKSSDVKEYTKEIRLHALAAENIMTTTTSTITTTAAATKGITAIYT